MIPEKIILLAWKRGLLLSEPFLSRQAICQIVMIAPAVASKLRKSVTAGRPPVTTLIESATQLVMQTTIAIPRSISIPPKYTPPQ